LREGADGNLTELAQKLCVHPDTVKRWLIKLNLRSESDFPGAKYSPSNLTQVQTWDRPCSCCRQKIERPKWKYYCDDCSSKLGHEDGDSPFGGDYGLSSVKIKRS
jgi:Zn finger protein HypA/HybF involved in hydrogenase expression